MNYDFITETLIKSNNKQYIKIPFNVWETCSVKGMISINVKINDFSFECKLIPKGNGNYLIPLTEQNMKQIVNTEKLNVSFEIIEHLSRINSNSPYSIENPVRKIDGINLIMQPKPYLCGQTCVAMLAGVSVDEVIAVMKAKSRQASMSKIIETLDYYGIKHASKNVYLKKIKILPKLCILTENANGYTHFSIYYNGLYYDPAFGLMKSCHPDFKVIAYLEILI
jgi:hypothetical protein